MKKWGVITIVIVGILGGVFFFFSRPQEFSEQEKQAAIEKTLGRKEHIVEDEKTGNQIHTSAYLSFSYPARAKIFDMHNLHDTPSPDTLERFDLEFSEPRMSFITTVAKTQVASFADLPAVLFRRSKKDLYKESQITIDGIKGLLFTKFQDDGEETAFVLHKGNLYTFSATAQQASNELNTTFTSIVSTVTFPD
jgi:hypothetical protein